MREAGKPHRPQVRLSGNQTHSDCLMRCCLLPDWLTCQPVMKAMIDETKRCCRCKESKLLTEFNKDSGQADGLNARCRQWPRAASSGLEDIRQGQSRRSEVLPFQGQGDASVAATKKERIKTMSEQIEPTAPSVNFVTHGDIRVQGDRQREQDRGDYFNDVEDRRREVKSSPKSEDRARKRKLT
jgi:hypothetical protein